MEKVIKKVEEAYKEIDKLPLDLFEDEYKRQKKLNEVYNKLIECEHELKQLRH